MAYNKNNYYKRIIEVQEIVKREKFQHGLTYKEIFYKFIEPRYHISIKTYRNWLGVPAKRDLKKLQENDKKNGNQLTFNF
ncbi:hypothetical protein [Amniculibacterium sp. G2-70]|uniref:hypothetical protein n=1 Tax=Amniculibacterium sp. G2-70 TaxID=2767188 RepID=UPI0016542ED5|nr:hypothetical protein [Amniculibacterium sp. G2-70]